MSHYLFTNHEVLDRLSRHCPRAISIYLACLHRANDNGMVRLSKQKIQDEVCESWTRFMNCLRDLAREGVLEYHRMGDEIVVQIVLEDLYSEGSESQHN